MSTENDSKADPEEKPKPDKEAAAQGQRKKGPPERPSGPPVPEEVRAALEGAGYPFELRVFNRLKEREMNPVFGMRMRVDDTEETREIDVRAHRLTKGTSGLLALIQVKRIPEGAFVGFLGEQPARDWVRYQRSRCGGSPSYWLSPVQVNPHGPIMVGEEGLGPAFDRFAAPPYCTQWCVAQRQRDNERSVLADHPKRIWEDLATLVRAKTRDAYDTSSRNLRDTISDAFVKLYFWFPALVVDAPMYTYDVNSETLAQVERLTLTVSVDTFNGVVEDYVDVVTFTGMETLIDDYIAAAADLKERMTDHVETALLGVARLQRKSLKEDDVAAAAREFARGAQGRTET